MPTIALSMIVRNGAALLKPCLESVAGLVDEIVIADTGSTDSTMIIARKMGARVFSVPWRDNFAEARNLALAQVKSDWVLILDADEQLDVEARENLPALLSDRSFSGYQVTIRNYVASLEDRVWDRASKPNDFRLAASSIYPAYVEHENVRLFQRDPEIYFVGRVHESVGPRIQDTGKKLGKAGLCIHHFGLVADPKTRADKNHFYRRLGRQKLEEMPNDAQAHLELGLVELDNFQNLDEALKLFERSCQLNRRLGIAWFFQALTLLKLERFHEALKCAGEAERQGHRTVLVAETTGDAHYNLKEYQLASESYARAVQLDASSPSLQSKHGLGMLRSGNATGGLTLIKEAIKRKPQSGELHDRLILCLVWLDRVEEAAEAAEVKIGSVEMPEPGDFLRTASLWAKAKEWGNAIAVLRAGLEMYPDSDALRRGWNEAALATGSVEPANVLESSCSNR